MNMLYLCNFTLRTNSCHIMLLWKHWKKNLKTVPKVALFRCSTTVCQREKSQRGNRWVGGGHYSSSSRLLWLPKLFSSVINPPPSTPPPVEKAIVPRCSDNFWNNNSEINGSWDPFLNCSWHWSLSVLHPVPVILPEYMQFTSSVPLRGTRALFVK